MIKKCVTKLHLKIITYFDWPARPIVLLILATCVSEVLKTNFNTAIYPPCNFRHFSPFICFLHKTNLILLNGTYSELFLSQLKSGGSHLQHQYRPLGTTQFYRPARPKSMLISSSIYLFQVPKERILTEIVSYFLSFDNSHY